MKTIIVAASRQSAGKETIAAVCRHAATVALANSTDGLGEVLALENELALDNEGWALLAPFGEHRKTRTVQRGGLVSQETFVQIFDDAAVNAVLANEQGDGILSRIKRALVKRPIYNGHPDVRLYAPETVTLGNDKLIPLGLNQACRKTARGLEFQPLLVPDGRKAVEEDGCKFPSGLFLLQKTGVVRANGDIEVRPFKLASIGLTPHPNISGVDSLANAKPADQPTKPQTKEPDMKLIAGWLIAQGVALANTETPTETMVLEAIQKLHAAKATDLVTLGNDKQTLTGTVTNLTGDKTKLVTGATLPTDLVTAANRIVALENASAESPVLRKKFLEARVDLLITQGKAPVADRAKEVDALVALGNDKLDAALADLDKRPVKFAVATAINGDRKAGADSTRSAHEQVITLANSDPRYKDIQDFGTAFNRVLTDHPTLAEQLRQKPTEEKTTTATT